MGQMTDNSILSKVSSVFVFQRNQLFNLILISWSVDIQNYISQSVMSQGNVRKSNLFLHWQLFQIDQQKYFR